MVIPRLYRFVSVTGAVRMGISHQELAVGDTIECIDAQHLSAWMRGENPHGASMLKTASTRRQDQIVKMLPPIPFAPPAIFGIGLNFHRHAAEVELPIPNQPIFFMKNPASLCGPEDPIVVPSFAQEPPECDYEVELAVVLGRDAKDVPISDALEYVLGYTVANDVSARRWQGPKRSGGQWCRSKSFDTFTPLGPALTLSAGVDPTALALHTELNGKTMQNSTTADMIFDVAHLIHFLSQGTTLQAGSIILTGTPEGVGYTRKPPVWLRDGDTITMSIESLGQLTNRVVYA